MIVFDASTLILLAKTSLLETFLDASKLEAVAPREVEREACVEKQSVDAQIIRRLIGAGKIRVEVLSEHRLFDELRRDLGLGAGEAEAIALAVTKRARFVATDDGNAINACKLVKLPFTSALGILVRLREKGLVTRPEALLKLESLERFGRYKKSLVAAVRSQLEGI